MHIDCVRLNRMHERMNKRFDLDWRLIRAFVAVLQEGTLSAAARRLATTQPTVGRQIRELEEACGEILFLRRGTRLEPTRAALDIRARAEDVEASVHALGQAFAGIGHSTSPRTVRITAPTLIADHLLPSLLPRILHAVPQAQIQVEPSDQVQDLQRRHADIALRLTDPRQPDLIAQRIGRADIGFFASQAYVARTGKPSDPADLRNHRMILPADERLVAAVAARASIDPAELHAPLRSDDLRHRHALMAAGLGVGTGHHWMARTDGALVRLLPDFVIDTLPVWQLTTEDVRTSKVLRAVHEVLSQVLKDVLV